MPKDELKPCPFCGRSAEVREMAPYPNQAPNKWWALCPACDIAPDAAWDRPREEAIAAWNTRASLDTQAGVVEALREALEPLANLDDVNMNDPLSKWLTVAQIKQAVSALSSGVERGPKVSPNDRPKSIRKEGE